MNRPRYLHAPTTLPPAWSILETREDGKCYGHRPSGLTVIWSREVHPEAYFGHGGVAERVWLHVSVAHPRRDPTWAEIREIKCMFLGPEAKAIMVLAAESEWVNIHGHCFHLFCPADGDVLPDFTRGSGSL